MAAPTSIRNTRVKRFSPASASDSLDATDEFPGACTLFTNLVPDITTRNIWTCRPAATQIMDFNSCPNLTAGHTPGIVKVFKVVGKIVYGLFEDKTTGTDGPFAYNLATNLWITVTVFGSTPAAITNLAPPFATIDMVGVFLVVTHPHFVNPDYFGWFNLSNPTSPSWNSGNTTAGSALSFAAATTGPALWVCQFNQRAYFGVGVGTGGTQPAVWATDVLSLKITNATQVLTFGDNLFLTCAAPLPLSNQLGGIIQALMVFKGSTNIYQITGDLALSNWTVNTLNVATGTLAPRSLCRTPMGLAFLSPDGVRIIDQNATVSDPIGAAGKGVVYPFIANQTAAVNSFIGCDGVTIKVSNEDPITTTPEEYWFNLVRKVWSGPHGPFASSQYDVYNGQFISAPFPTQSINLFYTPTDPNAGSTFTELSIPMTFTMQSAMLEDSGQMAQSELSELQIVAGSDAAETLTVTLINSDGTTINTSTVVVNPTGATPGLYPYRVDFPAISVFNRMSVQVTGASASGVRLGDIWMRIKTLGYIDNNNP